jgi:hypothetical protein
MKISLSPDTKRLIEERMKQSGLTSADEVVRLALQSLAAGRGEDYEDLD